MGWTAPGPTPTADGPIAGDDRPILEGFLGWQRDSLLNICAGLTGEQLAARPVAPSNLSLLGFVRHLAKVERIWFRQRVANESIGPLYDPERGKDADFDDLDPADAADAMARLSRSAAGPTPPSPASPSTPRSWWATRCTPYGRSTST